MHKCQETGQHTEAFYAHGLYFYCLYCGRKGATLDEVLNRLEELETLTDEEISSKEEVASLKARVSELESGNKFLMSQQDSFQSNIHKASEDNSALMKKASEYLQEIASLKEKLKGYPEDMPSFMKDFQYFKLRAEQLEIGMKKIWDATGGFVAVRPLWELVDELKQKNKELSEGIDIYCKKVDVLHRTASILSNLAAYGRWKPTLFQKWFQKGKNVAIYAEAHDQAVFEIKGIEDAGR